MRRYVPVLAAVLVILIAGVAIYASTSGGPGATAISQDAVSSSTAASTSTASVSGSTASVATSTVRATSTNEGATGNWTTYHANNARTGYEASPSFDSASASWTSVVLDGAVYAEPLVFGGSVYVATENNSVYSLDAQSGAALWRTNLGQPVPGNALPCGNIDPSGITGTPVIDASSGAIFVVAFSGLHHFLYGLDVKTGAVLSNRSADPPGFVISAQQQRSALSLSDGVVYVPFGGLAGDCGQYHGWVVGLDANGTGGMLVYQVPTQREGGIWAPSGVAIDPSGTLYVSVGNGASDTKFDLGDSVISLSPSLVETEFFAPTNWVQLNEDDTDLGSVGPAIVAPGTLFQVGKEGVGYLLNASRLGGIGGQVFSASVCAGSYGGTAQAGSMLFVPCTNGLFELQLGSSSFSTGWHTPGFFAGPPIVTGSVVWTVDTTSSVLYGFDAATGVPLFSFQLGSVVHFCTPSAGDGRVFVAEGGRVEAFVLSSG